jgi:hypothetical protein
MQQKGSRKDVLEILDEMVMHSLRDEQMRISRPPKHPLEPAHAFRK